ncbi:hypothetical protein M422DRAFT_242676 [Sphaerobolus stellatus SS14]|nr:hypothetical protein M422DRAFT_242676 [Sphaerobolus stellatus SS14]
MSFNPRYCSYASSRALRFPSEVCLADPWLRESRTQCSPTGPPPRLVRLARINCLLEMDYRRLFIGLRSGWATQILTSCPQSSNRSVMSLASSSAVGNTTNATRIGTGYGLITPTHLYVYSPSRMSSIDAAECILLYGGRRSAQIICFKLANYSRSHNHQSRIAMPDRRGTSQSS